MSWQDTTNDLDVEVKDAEGAPSPARPAGSESEKVDLGEVAAGTYTVETGGYVAGRA